MTIYQSIPIEQNKKLLQLKKHTSKLLTLLAETQILAQNPILLLERGINSTDTSIQYGGFLITIAPLCCTC